MANILVLYDSHSGWRPGTRYSYCNAGPAVAAAIVERVAGQRFEDYVEAHFFEPLGMSTADYFLAPRSAAILTQLYRSDGQTPLPFHHICLRPSGAVLASAADMGACLRLFLNRGRVGSGVIRPEHALRRMETPTTYWGAQAGLATGSGLNNYTTLDDRGLVWHGHEGGMEGSQAEMAYLPDLGIGANTGSAPPPATAPCCLRSSTAHTPALTAMRRATWQAAPAGRRTAAGA